MHGRDTGRVYRVEEHPGVFLPRYVLFTLGLPPFLTRRWVTHQDTSAFPSAEDRRVVTCTRFWESGVSTGSRVSGRCRDDVVTRHGSVVYPVWPVLVVVCFRGFECHSWFTQLTSGLPFERQEGLFQFCVCV